MTIVLVLLAIVLLLAAGAIELWWNATARQRQRAAAEHTESRLAPAPAVRTPGAALGPAAATASRPGAQQAAIQTLPRWQAILRRANLADKPATWIMIVLPGILVALVAGLRMHSWAFALLAAVIYAIATVLWIKRRIERQRQQIIKQLPDFLENMVRLAGTGNSLSMAFQAASTQITPPLRPLLDSTLVQARTGMDLDRALLQAARPYDLPELETLAVILGTSLRIGGRSDQILQRMSDFLRDLDQIRKELTATTSEIRASAWVLVALPPLCAFAMAMISPEFIMPMLDDPLGQKLLLGALAMEAFGGFLLYRLAKSL